MKNQHLNTIDDSIVVKPTREVAENDRRQEARTGAKKSSKENSSLTDTTKLLEICGV